jgi:hypothetical protein
VGSAIRCPDSWRVDDVKELTMVPVGYQLQYDAEKGIEWDGGLDWHPRGCDAANAFPIRQLVAGHEPLRPVEAVPIS